MTRAEVLQLRVGDVLERCLDTRDGKPLPGAHWAFRGAVTEITYRGTNVDGEAYVGFYTAMGEGGSLSGSITEGEEHVRFAAPAAAPVQAAVDAP